MCGESLHVFILCLVFVLQRAPIKYLLYLAACFTGHVENLYPFKTLSREVVFHTKTVEFSTLVTVLWRNFPLFSPLM